MSTVNPIRNIMALTVFASYNPPELICSFNPTKAAIRINTEMLNNQTDHFFILSKPYAAAMYKILLMKFVQTTSGT